MCKSRSDAAFCRFYLGLNSFLRHVLSGYSGETVSINNLVNALCTEKLVLSKKQTKLYTVLL